MMRQRTLDTDVLTAARKRIQNIFANGVPVYLSFSGGKDSLVVADLALSLVEEGAIDRRLLRFEFIDEEAIFPCVEQINMDWRARTRALGIQFLWYSLEVRHYSCLNLLENNESFICWDRTKRNAWVREPPEFAIRSHKALRPRKDTYQEFLANVRDGVHMTGVRASESVQRRVFMGLLNASGMGEKTGSIHPIYDWTDADVWRYLRERKVAIPDAYQHLYQIGTPLKNLRISQFFSIDTAPSLARIAEFYPGLMERILQREPTAYLVSLYWDSEMFRRRSPTRRKLDELGAPVDHRKRMMDMLAKPPEQALRSASALQIFGQYRNLVLKFGSFMNEAHCRAVCDALVAGDPKGRVVRGLITRIVKDAGNAASNAAAAGARDQRAGRAA